MPTQILDSRARPLVRRLQTAADNSFRYASRNAEPPVITDDCVTALRGFIEVGASTLETEVSREEQFQGAESKIGLFAEDMVFAARDRHSALTEAIFEHVHARLCPLWPFC